ncbi:hypothetical protein [Vibrio mimicus]|uniref:hypothetical protein n=1 Tax=Vibrio mimicus TaxID=674 RepID=UPI0021CC2174|nr:hypothetical protein [Vibrio mimicus]
MEKSNAVQIGQVNAEVTNNRHLNPRVVFEYNITIETASLKPREFGKEQAEKTSQ